MTREEAEKGWREVLVVFDEYAGKKLVGVKKIEGTEVILTGPSDIQEIYRQACRKAVACMEILGMDGWLPKEGDAVYRWTKGAMIAAQKMRHNWN